MKKLILLLTILLGANIANASLPGFKKKMRVRSKIELPQIPISEPDRRLLAAPPKTKIVDINELEKETSERLSKKEHYHYSRIENTTYEYDNFGFRKKMTYDNGDYRTYEYTWHIPGKIWDSRTVCEYTGYNDALNSCEKTYRTFHPNGAVATHTFERNGYAKVYEYNDEGILISKTLGEGESKIKYSYTSILR